MVVTRPEPESGPLSAALREWGAEAVHRPVLVFHPTGRAAGLSATLQAERPPDWLVLTSPRAADTLAEAGVFEAPCPRGLRIAVAGHQTAQAVRRHGWAAHLVPDPSGAAPLLAAMEASGVGGGDRVLFAASSLARPLLADGLRALGAVVETVAIYGPVARPLHAAEWEGEARLAPWDALTFTSPSAVSAVESGLSDTTLSALRRLPAGVQGPTTGAAARDAGWQRVVEARPHTFRGLARALADYLGPKEPPSS